MLKTKNMLKDNFDRTVEQKANGIYTLPSNGMYENFKVRSAVEYCHKNDKDISTLSDTEIRLFLK